MTFEELRNKYPRLIRPEDWFECREGWASILDAYFAVVGHVLPPTSVYEILQIKEKMGTLRVYDCVRDAPTEAAKGIADARELAEARSYYACEWCGQPGILRNRQGYYTTTCDEHAVYEGRMAVPLDPPAVLYIGAKGGESWRRYDPELDMFVPSEAPEWY